MPVKEAIRASGAAVRWGEPECGLASQLADGERRRRFGGWRA